MFPSCRHHNSRRRQAAFLHLLVSTSANTERRVSDSAICLADCYHQAVTQVRLSGGVHEHSRTTSFFRQAVRLSDTEFQAEAWESSVESWAVAANSSLECYRPIRLLCYKLNIFDRLLLFRLMLHRNWMKLRQAFAGAQKTSIHGLDVESIGWPLRRHRGCWFAYEFGWAPFSPGGLERSAWGQQHSRAREVANNNIMVIVICVAVASIRPVWGVSPGCGCREASLHVPCFGSACCWCSSCWSRGCAVASYFDWMSFHAEFLSQKRFIARGALDEVLHPADPDGPSRLPLRWTGPKKKPGTVLLVRAGPCCWRKKAKKKKQKHWLGVAITSITHSLMDVLPVTGLTPSHPSGAAVWSFVHASHSCPLFASWRWVWTYRSRLSALDAVDVEQIWAVSWRRAFASALLAATHRSVYICCLTL